MLVNHTLHYIHIRYYIMILFWAACNGTRIRSYLQLHELNSNKIAGNGEKKNNCAKAYHFPMFIIEHGKVGVYVCVFWSFRMLIEHWPLMTTLLVIELLVALYIFAGSVV